jgi:GXGXG motif
VHQETGCEQLQHLLQVGGMSVKLIGEANDYVGKGMAGGDIVIVPPEEQTLDVRSLTTVAYIPLQPSSLLGVWPCAFGSMTTQM